MNNPYYKVTIVELYEGREEREVHNRVTDLNKFAEINLTKYRLLEVEKLSDGEYEETERMEREKEVVCR